MMAARTWALGLKPLPVRSASSRQRCSALADASSFLRAVLRVVNTYLIAAKGLDGAVLQVDQAAHQGVLSTLSWSYNAMAAQLEDSCAAVDVHE